MCSCKVRYWYRTGTAHGTYGTPPSTVPVLATVPYLLCSFQFTPVCQRFRGPSKTAELQRTITQRSTYVRYYTTTVLASVPVRSVPLQYVPVPVPDPVRTVQYGYMYCRSAVQYSTYSTGTVLVSSTLVFCSCRKWQDFDSFYQVSMKPTFSQDFDVVLLQQATQVHLMRSEGSWEPELLVCKAGLSPIIR